MGLYVRSNRYLLTFTAPNISFDYCEDTQPVSFTISNIGDGAAHSVHTLIDFDPLTVSNVSSGASYNATENRFELDDPLEPGARRRSGVGK